MPFPVPRHRHRVDREHLIPGGQQGLHKRAAVGLDPDHHLRRRLEPGAVIPDQLMQRGHAFDALGQTTARQQAMRPISQAMHPIRLAW